ncbi:MAG TPA: 30S ribosomal protein S15 [Candidatus Saccharimonadales bacterium]|nr:30S ribosomal protein S15 [Candidatus Saccharimonadales bacterium]
MLTKAEKLAIIKEFGKNEHDSGSTEVQIALLTKNMALVQSHLEVNKKDFSSHRGLMQMVNDRKQLLIYLQETNEASYKDVIKRLGIRK